MKKEIFLIIFFAFLFSFSDSWAFVWHITYDTDGGFNPGVAGTCSQFWPDTGEKAFEESDECYGDTVKEMVASGPVQFCVGIRIDCGVWGGPGWTCEGGACVPPADTPPKPWVLGGLRCEDVDGFDFFAKGTCRVLDGEGKIVEEYTDYCSVNGEKGEWGDLFNEFFCDVFYDLDDPLEPRVLCNSRPEQYNRRPDLASPFVSSCPGGRYRCFDGACLATRRCEKSDDGSYEGGLQPETGGVCLINNHLKGRDTCRNDYELLEYYCQTEKGPCRFQKIDCRVDIDPENVNRRCIRVDLVPHALVGDYCGIIDGPNGIDLPPTPTPPLPATGRPVILCPAQCRELCAQDPNCFCIENPLCAATICEFLKALTQFVAVLFFVLTPLLILIGAYFLITSAGEEERVKTGKKIIFYAIIILAILLLLWSITAAIQCP